MIKKTIFLAALLTSAAPAWSINKCTGADGTVTYQEVACSANTKASQEVKTWINEGYGSSGRRVVTPNLKLTGPPAAGPMLNLYRRWADAERLAFSTSRIALAGPAAGMQALQREAEAMKPPECLGIAHDSLTTLITKSSEAILQFMGKEEVTGMAYQIVYRQDLVPKFERAIAKAKCD